MNQLVSFLAEQAPLYGWTSEPLSPPSDGLTGVTLNKDNWRINLVLHTDRSLDQIEQQQSQWERLKIRGLWLCQTLPEKTPRSQRISPTGWLIPKESLPLFPLYLRSGKPALVGLPAPRQMDVPIPFETFITDVLERRLRFFPQLNINLPAGLPIRFYPISCPRCRELSYGYTSDSTEKGQLPPDVPIESQHGCIPDPQKLNDFIFRSDTAKAATALADVLDLVPVRVVGVTQKINGLLPSGFACSNCQTPFALDFVQRESRKIAEYTTNQVLKGWLPGPLMVHLPSPFWSTDTTVLAYNSSDY